MIATPIRPRPIPGNGGIIPPWLESPWRILPWPPIDAAENGRTDTMFISGSLKIGTLKRDE